MVRFFANNALFKMRNFGLIRNWLSTLRYQLHCH